MATVESSNANRQAADQPLRPASSFNEKNKGSPSGTPVIQILIN